MTKYVVDLKPGDIVLGFGEPRRVKSLQYLKDNVRIRISFERHSSLVRSEHERIEVKGPSDATTA